MKSLYHIVYSLVWNHINIIDQFVEMNSMYYYRVFVLIIPLNWRFQTLYLLVVTSLVFSNTWFHTMFI